MTPSGDLGVLDSGITCSLTREDRANLIDTFRAVVLSDGARVGELFLERSSHDCRDRQGFIGEMQVTRVAVYQEIVSVPLRKLL